MTERQFDNTSGWERGITRCSLKQAAVVLGVSESTVRKRIKEGLIPAERDGRRWVVLLPEVLLAVESGQQSALDTSPISGVPATPDPASDLAAQLPPSRDRSASMPARGAGRSSDGDTEASMEQSAAFGLQEPDRTGATSPLTRASPYMSVRLDRPEAEPPNIPSPPPGGPARERMVPRGLFRELLVSLLLGLVILFLADSVLTNDAIPLLAEREAVPVSREPSAPGRTASAPDVVPASSTDADSGQSGTMSPSSAPTPHPQASQSVGGVAEAAPAGGPSAAAPETLARTSTAASPRSSTLAPLPSAAPTAMPPAPAALAQQVASAEATVRTGEIVARLDYGNGSGSSARIVFDTGGSGTPPSVYIVSTYTGGGEPQSIERLMLGEQWWQKQSDGRWGPIPPQEAIWGQIQGYMPYAGDATNVQRDEAGAGVWLRWHDAARASDVALRIDPVTHVPLEMHKVLQSAGSTLDVIYRSWNEAVTLPNPNAY